MKKFTEDTYKENDIEFSALLKCRKKSLLLAAVIAFFLSLLFVNIIPPVYKAETVIALENVSASIGQVDVKKSADTISAAATIKSRPFALEVINRLGQKQDPESFLDKVEVESVKDSNIIKVGYKAESPEQAAAIANEITDAYLFHLQRNNAEAIQKISAWLDQRYEDLRKRVAASKQKLLQFQKNNNLPQINDEKLTAGQQQKLQTELAARKLDLVELEEKRFLLEDAYAKGNYIEIKDMDVAYNVLRQLRHKEADIVLKLSKLSLRYGPKHPKMINARKEHQKIKNLINDEITLIQKTLEAKAMLIDFQIGEIENILQTYNGGGIDDNKISKRLSVLKEDIRHNEIILNEFLKAYKTVDVPAHIYQPNVHIITAAVPPKAPFYPNKPWMIIFITLLTPLLLAAYILYCEKFDKTYKTAKQLESKTGVPCFGIFPLVKNLDDNQSVSDFLMQKPGSHVAEAVRSIRMNLRLAKKDPEKKSSVIVITSSSPDEGKTTLSSSMARLAAKSGEKTILIDCDLRRPKLQEAFGQKPEKTLVEYLTGKATLDDIIVKDKESGANVIFARAVPSTALDLISKDRMKNLIGFLRQNYNLVLLDSAASLAASDAKFLSSFSDQVIYTVAWNSTSREVVNTGLKQFADIDENALALILTKVDIKRQSLYDGAIQYYNRNKKYYSD